MHTNGMTIALQGQGGAEKRKSPLLRISAVHKARLVHH
jgi:hypothetical protein